MININTKRKDVEMRPTISMSKAKDRAIIWNIINRHSRNTFTLGGEVKTVNYDDWSNIR